MRPPTLERPLLLGTAWSAPVDGVEALERLLRPHYAIQDLEPIRDPLQPYQPLQLEAAMASLGEIALTSVLGMPLTLAVEPLHGMCMVALPSLGWGQYQLEDHRLDNALGESIAFLPAVGWRLINDNTGGTALQFTEDALISRLRAISGCALSVQQLVSLLSVPFVIRTNEARVNHHYRQLLAALAMVDSSFRFGPGVPDPMLRLDDLILRSLALLLVPQLAALDGGRAARFHRHDLRRSVLELMEWMRAHLHRPISLTEIEQRTHYGRRAIQLGFKAQVGCGPMQWLRRQRLEQALHQLQCPGPDTSVSQVAQACGYLNLASFSRDFRDRFGIAARQVLLEARSAYRSVDDSP